MADAPEDLLRFAFASANVDLFDKNVLARWYRPERLATPAARRTFLLLEPPP